MLYACMEDVVAHGQAFRQVTDARSGARHLITVLLRATQTCAVLLLRSHRAHTEDVEDMANTGTQLQDRLIHS